MAQTKRKRRTKHRGTAAGTVTVRGRTGRPPSPEERKKAARESARDARLNQPPTWNSAIKRAALASAFMFVFLLLASKGSVITAVLFGVVAFIIYVPAGYYLENYLWRRRIAKRERGG